MTSRECVLVDGKECDRCGECLKCDLDPSKQCTNCCRCIDSSDVDFRAVEITEILWQQEGPETDKAAGLARGGVQRLPSSKRHPVVRRRRRQRTEQ